jgi:hypothetical protein
MVPAIIIIIAGFFSGFSEQSYEQIAENLLKERTQILQAAYSGSMEIKQAESRLSQIETYPLLSEDVGNLRDLPATEFDVVKSMEFIETTQERKMLQYVSLTVTIRWYMSGLESDYVSDYDYSVILKTTRDGYVLSEFNPK